MSCRRAVLPIREPVFYGNGKIRADIETFQAAHAALRILCDDGSVTARIKGIGRGKYIESAYFLAIAAFLSQEGVHLNNKLRTIRTIRDNKGTIRTIRDIHK